MGELRRETIQLSREAVAAGRALVAMPCMNASMGPTLEVVGLEGEGYLFTLTDPMGEVIWTVVLEAT